MNQTRRLLREFKAIQNIGSTDYAISTSPEDITTWQAVLFGAKDTPWEGAVLKMQIKFPPEYPRKPPMIKFIESIPFHPNVYGDGKICLNLLKDDWQPSYGVDGLLTAIQALLLNPNPDSPANNTAGVLFTQARPEYDRYIRNFVKTTWTCTQ